MSKRAWLTCDSLPGSNITLQFVLPDSEEWRAQVRGALLPLCDPANFEEFGALSAIEQSDVWRDYVLRFFDEVVMWLPGMIVEYGGFNAPSGWLLCNGASVAVASYPALYDAIGDEFGSGLPYISDHFYLPDMRARVTVSPTLQEGDYGFPGQIGGAFDVVLGVQHMPAHSHSLKARSDTAGSNAPSGKVLAAPSANIYRALSGQTGVVDMAAESISSVGGGSAHSNVQPYIVVNKIIKY